MKQTQTYKNKAFVCKLHSVYTKDMVSVFIKEMNTYAILKQINDDWYLSQFTFRKNYKGKIYTVTTFKENPKYWKGYFFFKDIWKFIPKKHFLPHKRIVFFEGFGQIPEQFIESA